MKVLVNPLEATKSLRCPPLAEFDFNLVAEPVNHILTPASENDIKTDDAVVRETQIATVRADAVVSVQGPDIFRVRLRSSDESRATVDQNGYVETKGEGTVNIFAETPVLTRRYVHEANTSSGGVSYRLAAFDTGTLGAAIHNTMSALVPASTDKRRFAAINHAAAQYTTNADFFGSSADWSGVKVWDNGTKDFRRGATVISRRHVIMANHYRVPNNWTLRWIAADGAVVERNLLNSVRIDNPATDNTHDTDIAVGVLDADLPETVAAYPVLPSDWLSYIRTFSEIPNVTWNQDGEAHVSITHQEEPFEAVQSFAAGIWYQRHLFAPLDPEDHPWIPASRSLRFLDSGQPNFLLIGDQPILTGCHLSGNFHNQLSAWATEIQTAMDALAPGYTLQTADLSAYPTFND